MTQTYKIITGTAAIEAAITSINTRGKILDKAIQVAALSCMAHHSEHGDTTLLNSLVKNMPKGSRVNALREFIQTYPGVTYDEDTEVFSHVKGAAKFDLEVMSETMWTEFKPEKAYIPFDAAAAITAIIKKIDKADVAKGDKVTPAQATAIRTAASAMGLKITS